MNYLGITKSSMVNGIGVRCVLWVAGCSHHCVNCHNPDSHDPNAGAPFDSDAEKELFEALAKPWCDGITFSGGDPLHINNRQEISRLIKKAKQQFPDKTVWLYTGYTWENVISNPECSFIKDVDVLVDGRYYEKYNTGGTLYRGSANQELVDVPRSIQQGKLVKWRWEGKLL